MEEEVDDDVEDGERIVCENSRCPEIENSA